MTGREIITGALPPQALYTWFKKNEQMNKRRRD